MTNPSVTEVRLLIPSNHLMIELLGERDMYLRQVEDAFPTAQIVARGNEIMIDGPERDSDLAKTVVEELLILVQEGQALDEERVVRVIDMVRKDVPSPSGIFKDSIIVGRGRHVRPKTLGQKQYVDAIRENTLVFGVGPAGTGKTYLAMACAIEALGSGSVKRIILSRPAVEAGERLGFLPGDLAAKVDPYLRPLYDALYEMLGFETVNKYIERNIIEVAPLAFMRGRTLNNAFIILDEAQNTTREQMKMFLTRIGFGSTAVITGDATQIDLPRGSHSGLTHVSNILSDVEGIGFTYFGNKDVVRHPLVQRIVEAYDEFESKATPLDKSRP